MTTATRLLTDMSGWAPITQHYQVPDGYLAVTVAAFLTAKGTTVFRCTAEGIILGADDNPANGMTPIARFDDGTTHEDALAALGYTVA